jgi:hypothetical protein
MTTGAPEKHPEPWLPENRRSGLDVRLVVHTHWDREWYRPFSQFRGRLVALIDEVLDGVAGSPILLDGQAVVLEDYLEIRPERSADISTALRQGALEAGPWYVLADSLIPSGEGLVRNLLAGRRVLRSLRAVAPDVLYCPDSFGHPASLPAIAAGFGYATVILWRGYGGASHPQQDTARWQSPDESSVILYHLPPDGYEFGSHLPPEPDAAAHRWKSIREVLEPRSTTGLVLLTVGADHHAPQKNLDVVIAALKDVVAPDTVVRSSIDAFGRELGERASTIDLPAIQGELRDSYGYTWTLQGTLAARAALKRRYALTERLLVRDAEPWAALARLRGDGVDRRHLARAAWRQVLLCQPHDTLCGCSIDDVATAMSTRLDEAAAAAIELRDASIMSVTGHDGDAARTHPARWKTVVLVRNAAAHARSGVAELDVDLVLDDAPVGPASAGIEPKVRRTGPVAIGHPPVPVQELSRQRVFAREEAPRHYPWNRLVERRRVLAWVSDVPPLGLATLPVEERRRKVPVAPSRVSAAGKAISSEWMQIIASASGLRVAADGRTAIDDWLRFEVEGERGDLYTRSAIPGTHSIGTLNKARVTAKGPLRAELTSEWRLSVPERRLTSATGEARRAAALRQTVRAVAQLDAGASYARVIVSGEQLATDVRIRVGFSTGVGSPRVFADAAFGAVERHPIESRGGKEAAPPTASLQRYVSVFNDTAGATIFSDGLAEYEVTEDGMVWVTLIRAVGELSRHDLPERPGHAGYPVPAPLAQSLGPFEAGFGFAQHGPRSASTIHLIEQIADDVLLPLHGESWRTAVDPVPRVIGPALFGRGLALSTMKESEDGEWVVLRCVNLLDEAVDGGWQLPGVREVVRSRLDEAPLEPGGDRFMVPPRGTMTILVR